HQVAVGLRMNPDVNPQTHPYITTGLRENKFGMDESQLPELIKVLERYRGVLHLRGLAVHIGSQMLDLGAAVEAIEKLVPVYEDLQSRRFPLSSFDIGGGVGIDYTSADETR